MKKTFTILLGASLILSLCACGNKDGGDVYDEDMEDVRSVLADFNKDIIYLKE